MTATPEPVRPAARWWRRGGRVHPVVAVPAVLVAAAMLLPVVYLVLAVLDLPTAELRELILDPELARLAARTVGLALAVTVASLALALPLAWLTVRTDLPGRRLWAVAVAVPLVVPSYVGGYTLVATFAPGGLVEELLGVRPPSPYGFLGAFTALTVFTFPYVLLPVQAALRGLDPSLEQASRSLGRGPVATFARVVLPQLRPAAGAGGLLVALYVFSDFGAVSLLRYSTFTRALYQQFRSAFDREPAALLGLVLVVLTVAVLVVEARIGRDRGGRYAGRGIDHDPAPPVRLGRWRWPALALCAGVVALGVIAPLGVIGTWLVRGLEAGEPIGFVLADAARTLQAGALGGLVAVACALPVAIWSARSHGRTARLVERVSFTGYALPGVVVALALVYIGVRTVEPLYQTLAMLIAAYVVLFLPQAIGTIRASLLQTPTAVEDAARTLGSHPLAVLRRVTLPLARPGAVAGGALVALTVMKELPATLLLAPIGFDTLATRVWSTTSEAFFARAAGPALVLVLLGALPLALTVRRR